LAGFLHCALETRWQRFGQFLNDFFDDFLNDDSMKILIFSVKISIFPVKIREFLNEKS